MSIIYMTEVLNSIYFNVLQMVISIEILTIIFHVLLYPPGHGG